MTSRIVAVILGLAGSAAATLLVVTRWEYALAFLRVSPNTGAALSLPLARLAWTITVAITLFAAITLLAASIGGWIEAMSARRRINALRHDPGLSGRWSAADWRAAFAHTSIANRAEAIVAAFSSSGSGPGTERRVVTDLTLLTDLDAVWLDRLTFRRMITPIPMLLLGVGGTLALFRYGTGEGGWETVLAAGTGGWLAVSLIYYTARVLLGPAIQLTVDAAIAAVRPLTALPQTVAVSASGYASDDREVSIETALNEVRASIERLLAAKP